MTMGLEECLDLAVCIIVNQKIFNFYRVFKPFCNHFRLFKIILLTAHFCKETIIYLIDNLYVYV